MKSYIKTVVTFVSLLLFVGCGEITPKPQAYPVWYKNRTLQSAKKYEIIGYGEGKSIKEAKANAKEEIASTLLSRVDSSNNENSFTQKSMSRLKVTSKLNLQNLKTLKQERVDKNFFVALLYKNLDLAYRIKEKVGNIHCNKQKTDSYLSQTPLVEKLNTTLGCRLNFTLERKNRAWYLNYNEFEELYTSTQNCFGRWG